MTISIITCNNAINYGARLQVYALSRHLQSMGHSVSVIDYNPVYVRFTTRLWYRPRPNIKEWIKLLIRYPQRKSDIAKHAALEQFSHSYTLLTDIAYHNVDELRANPPHADVYIAGSDQIWNTTLPNGNDPAYYLDFGPDEVLRVSYAASFAIPVLPESECDTIRKHLARFDSVSVREESAAEICRRLGVDSSLVCDPVFLLDAQQWSAIADSSGFGDGYLLVYDFEQSARVKTIAQRVARIRGLKIFSVSPYRLSYADRNYQHCTPEVFVGLIKNASCVVSNSLHGSIFSMVFRRDFFVVDRDDGLNIRMHDLLKRYELGHLCVSTSSPDHMLYTSPDYNIVSELLRRDILYSKGYLRDIINTARQ